jgi:hypothetical protein
MAGRRDCERRSIPITIRLAVFMMCIAEFIYLGLLAPALK